MSKNLFRTNFSIVNLIVGLLFNCKIISIELKIGCFVIWYIGIGHFRRGVFGTLGVFGHGFFVLGIWGLIVLSHMFCAFTSALYQNYVRIKEAMLQNST